MTRHPDSPLARIVRSGNLVDLREHEPSNRETFVRWYGDSEIAELLRHDLSPLSPARARSYFDSIIMPSSARGTCWAIHEHETGRLIGSTAVTDFRGTESCLFRIVIGEKDAWGHGYGTEATSLVLAEAFETLGMQEVQLEVFSYNIRAQRAYARVGFREVGSHTEWVAAHRRELNVLAMACSRGDWEQAMRQRRPEAGPISS